MDITHAKNKTGENGIALYENGRKCYYPDFYRSNNCAETSFVLDAKYKRLGSDEKVDSQDDEKTNTIAIGREDLFQMITYMHVLAAQHCALLYPIELKESNTCAIVPSTPRQLNGDGGEIIGIGIPIVNEPEFSKYCDSQGIIEKQLVVEIKKWM